MTDEEYARLLVLVKNPPAGSKLAYAKEFGIDLTLTLSMLRMDPEERIASAERTLDFLKELRSGIENR